MTNFAPLFLLDPEVVFLNHGSYGACPKPIFQAYQDWQVTLERQPVEFLDSRRALSPRMEEVRRAMAGAMGAAPEDIVAQVNATQALNIVAQSLDLQPGDEILTTDHEYAALEKTWAYVAARSGARIVPVTIPLPLHDESAFTETVLAGMTARTRVLFLSHITSATAMRFPIERAVRAAREREIITVIDGAHTPGHIPLDLTELGADFYAGNCHKWLMAPKGAAFLHVRPEMQDRIRPLTISHGWEPGHAGSDPGPFGHSAFIDSLEVQGTRDPSAFLAIPAAYAFRAAHDWEQVARRCAAMAAETGARLARLTGLAPLCAEPFRAPQMFAVRLPDCDPAALQRDLMARWKIEMPCYRWKEHCIARFSVQGYTTQAQLDLLVAALSEIFDLKGQVA